MSSVLRGISLALLITVITLLAGLVWTTMEWGSINMSFLVDIGLVTSCLIGGYYTGRTSGQWMQGGMTGLGYVGIGVMLLALFLPVSGIGVVQVLIEGGLLGIAAGAFGAGAFGANRLSSMGGRPKRPAYSPRLMDYNEERYEEKHDNRQKFYFNEAVANENETMSYDPEQMVYYDKGTDKKEPVSAMSLSGYKWWEEDL